ncbi:MAG: BolA family transcriptional regulator [Bdellovibrionales bacterium]|nr:BolA family transcriptional regulator [Bdellovibrionales bacterium]
MLIESRIQKKLNDAFQPVHLEVINESFRHSVPVGSETHFLIVVVSKDFENLSRIHRQRKVHEVLSEELGSGVHALSQRLMTPAEWQVNGKNTIASPNCEGSKKAKQKE